jgi:hypothetical protein
VGNKSKYSQLSVDELREYSLQVLKRRPEKARVLSFAKELAWQAVARWLDLRRPHFLFARRSLILN